MQVLINIQWAGILCLLVFIVFDWITGFAKAWKIGDIQSGAMFDGIIRKCAVVGVVLLAILCEVAMTYFPLPFDAPLVLPVCAYLILMETASIIENLTAINPSLKDNKLLALFTKQDRGSE